MTDLKAMPPDVELAWRKVEQSFREEQGRRARALDEQHRQLLEGMSARYADVTILKPPPEMLSVLSPEESARIVKMLRDVERTLENLPPEMQDAFWDLPLDDGFFDAVPLVLNPKLTDEQRAAELATFFARGEVEFSWLQLRRLLYPVVKGHSGTLATIFAALATGAIAKESSLAFCYFIACAVLFWAIDVEGNPD